MKNINSILYTLLMIVFLHSATIAQKDVVLNINHLLGEKSFELSMAAQNNLDHDFDVTRLEYYIAEISVIHDGGQELMVEDLYVLANASSDTEIELGSHDVDQIEGVSFHIGVDEANNHLDPTLWPEDHPLYPKSPSMHWGWAGGYRFVAMEGFGGASLDQIYQFHGLGDVNYFKTSVLNPSVELDGKHYIHIDADYSKAIEDIQVKDGVISHGELGAAKKVLQNFRDNVFSPGSAPSSVWDRDDLKELQVYPNPNYGSSFTIEGIQENRGTLQVLDIHGQLLIQQEVNLQNGTYTLELENTGVFFIQFIADNTSVYSTRVIRL
jgi:hypothetical protein